MNLPQLATKRPIATCMIFLLVLIIGTLSLNRLSIDLLPDLAYPVLAIRTVYPNGAPEDVENLVTRPIEEAVSTVSGIQHLSSFSSEGLSIVTIKFAWGSNMDFARLYVREKLDRLPLKTERPTIIDLDPSNEPIIVLSVGSPNLNQTKQFATDVLKRRLEQIDGVALASVTGGTDREIHIKVDAETAKALNVRIEQIAQALQLSNYSLPGGTIRQGRFRYALRTQGELGSLSDIRSLVIKHNADGSTIRLDDLAIVSDGVKERIGMNRLNGEEAVGIMIVKQAGANTVAVAAKVDAVVGQMSTEYPEMRISEIHNQAHFISLAINNVAQAMILGSVLAIFVLFFFLHDVRLPLVIAVSIPTSILAAFILFSQFGVHLNIMSLGGLALGTGLLVDNSIVVLENIFRRRGDNLDRHLAASQGAAEVMSPLFASTLTTVAVFIPVVFIGGVAGRLFRDQAFAVICSLLASLPTALTLIPVLASRLSSSHRKKDPAKPAQQGRYFPVKGNVLFRPIHRLTNRIFGRFFIPPALIDMSKSPLVSTMRIYERLLDKTLTKPVQTLCLVGLAFLVTLIVFTRIRKELIPAADSKEWIVDLTLARGVSMEWVAEVSAQLETLLLADSTVSSVFAQIAGTRYGSEMAGIVNLESARFRVRFRENSDPYLILRRIEKEWPRPPGCNLTFYTAKNIIARLFHMDDGDLQISITGTDLQTMSLLRQLVRNQANDVKGIVDIWAPPTAGAPEIRVHLDRQKAGRYGLTSSHISQTLLHRIQGRVATQLNELDHKIDIVLKSTCDSHTAWQDILKTHIEVDSLFLPLSEVVHYDIKHGPIHINRRNQVRCLKLYANVKSHSLHQVIAELQQRCSKIDIPFGYEIRYGGANEEMKRSFRELKYVLCLAVLLIYMILAAQFESLLHPLVVILSVPMALFGAVWALFITGTSLNILSIIGMVVLTGIAVNDAIIKISFIHERRRRGIELRSAILEAGRKRFRPIIMTSVTTMFGLLPLALASGPGSAMAKPTAISIVGGLFSSTVLTLLVIPVMYAIMENRSRPFKKQSPNRYQTYEESNDQTCYHS